MLDGDLAPVPIGVAGELYIGAAGLARGYLKQPALTAERFLPDPWAGTPGARFYRTGDLVRQLADGLLEFLGRVDRQVKIRGFRVELGEVEAAVAGHPEVRETAVVVGPDAHGQPRIIAYYAAVNGSSLAADELRSFLRTSLPSYMVPAALVPMPALPRTVSGKVDPQALPAPREEAADPAASGEAPRSGLERSIAEVWREVLGVEQVGVEDNFFDRGGHSLLLIRVHSRLQKILDREIPVVDLFNHPTIAASPATSATGWRTPATRCSRRRGAAPATRWSGREDRKESPSSGSPAGSRARPTSTSCGRTCARAASASASSATRS